MRTTLLFAIFLAFAFVSADQILQIQTQPPGYSLGSIDPVLHLEAFYDIACIDSSNSYFELLPALNAISIQNNTNVKFTIYFMSLSLHFNSFLLTKGLQTVTDYAQSPQDVWNYIYLIFYNQPYFWTDNTAGFTVSQIAQNLTNLVTSNANFTHLTPKQFYNALFDPVQATEALFQIQYAQYRGNIATPNYYANGVFVNHGDVFNTQDWIDFFDQYA